MTLSWMSATHPWKRKCRATATRKVTRSCEGHRATHTHTKKCTGAVTLLWSFPKQNEPHESGGWLKPRDDLEPPPCHLWPRVTVSGEVRPFTPMRSHPLMLQMLGTNSSQGRVKVITETVDTQTQWAVLVGCVQVPHWTCIHRAPSCMHHFRLQRLPWPSL